MRLIRQRDLVRFFGVNPSTIHEWRKKGILPSPVKLGRSVFYVFEEVEEILKTNRIRKRDIEEGK